MDKIINILLLVIIFVFDPLAISLVVAANFAFDKARPKLNLYGERVWDEDAFQDFEITTSDGLEDEPEWDEDHAMNQVLNDMVEDIEVKDAEEVKSKEEFFEQLDKIEKKKNSAPKIIKILNETSRQAQVLYDNGSITWIDKKGIDENKIKYL